MPRDGSNVYSVPAGTSATTNTTIESAKYNAFVADVETDLNTPRPIVAGGTGASSASAARTALGLSIGTDVQAYDAELAAIAALAVTDGNVIVGNGTTWVAESGATARASLGLTIGTDVQAYDAELAAIAGLTSAANKVPMFSGSGTATLLDFKDEDNMASDSATAVPSQQSVKAYVDTAVAGLASLGVGQTWSNVTGSRSAATSYQNTSGGPMSVAIAAISNNAGVKPVQVSSDNATWIQVGQFQSNSVTTDPTSVSIVVPDTWYYRINGTATITSWAELS